MQASAGPPIPVWFPEVFQVSKKKRNAVGSRYAGAEGSRQNDSAPLYVIVWGSMVPRDSCEARELERIMRDDEFVEVNELSTAMPRNRQLRVCGASRWVSVHHQYMELRRLGYDVSVHERASYMLDYDGA
jgi:hypothetical protein